MRKLSSLLFVFFLISCESTQEQTMSEDSSTPNQEQPATDSLQASGQERSLAETTFFSISPHSSEARANQCRIRIQRNGYNIRTGAGTRSGICGSGTLNIRRSGRDIVGYAAIDSSGRSRRSSHWIAVSSNQTRSCPNGIGFVHSSAFSPRSLQSFLRNECGSYRQASSPVAQPSRQERVREAGRPRDRSGRDYLFPLSQCLGLKNDGGLGHYGAPRRNGGRRYPHTGVDYYCPFGTPVQSPCDGRVQSVVRSNSGRAGRRLKVTCNDGNMFYMMHFNNTPAMHRGGPVRRGDTLGGCGNSGNARRQAPQVHVEFHLGRWGNRRDPQSLWDCRFDSGH
jgi:hypothetical protein